MKINKFNNPNNKSKLHNPNYNIITINSINNVESGDEKNNNNNNIYNSHDGHMFPASTRVQRFGPCVGLCGGRVKK